jgi:hypothetical protein
MKKAFPITWLLVVTPILLLGVLSLTEILLLADPSEGQSVGGNLSETVKQIIAVDLEVAKLFVASALAIVGVIAYYLKEHRTAWSNTEYACAIGALSASVISIFFGHLWMVAIRNQLAWGIHNPYSTSRVWSERLQYSFLILSLAWFGLLVLQREFLRPRSSPLPVPASGGTP